jgi:hypothetical protein
MAKLSPSEIRIADAATAEVIVTRRRWSRRRLVLERRRLQYHR